MVVMLVLVAGEGPKTRCRKHLTLLLAGSTTQSRVSPSMRSSSKEGSYLRLVDFVSLNSRPRGIKKKKRSRVSPSIQHIPRKKGERPGSGVNLILASRWVLRCAMWYVGTVCHNSVDTGIESSTLELTFSHPLVAP